jgi:alkylation response protein AidB-like acyl-CoA dehydrogenase
MDLLLSPDEEAIVSTVAALLSKSPLSDPEAAWSERGWTDLAALGVFGIGVPEEHGGLGFGVADEVLIFREFGRRLVRGPLLPTTLAVHVALDGVAADSGSTGELAQELMVGGRICGYAEPLSGAQMSVGETVSGRFRTWSAAGASVLVVVTPQWAGLVDAADLPVAAVPQTDTTVEIGVVELDACPALIRVDGPATATRAALLVAGLQTGIAEAALAESAAYAVTREQFGKPIGAFQAVKHRCADMAVRAEASRFQTTYAALSWDDPQLRAAAATQINAAVVVAADAGRRNSADNIQNHGAMGFTLEASPHRYARRSLVLESLLGTPRAALEQIVAEPTAGL